MILRSTGFGSPSSTSKWAASSFVSASHYWFAARHAVRDEDAWAPVQQDVHVRCVSNARLGNRLCTSFLPSATVCSGVLAIYGCIKQYQNCKVLRRKKPLCYDSSSPVHDSSSAPRSTPRSTPPRQSWSLDVNMIVRPTELSP
jgi:hypothetical protein